MAWLLTQSTQANHRAQALLDPIRLGFTDMVRQIIADQNPHVFYERALLNAVKREHLDMAESLLPLANAQAYDGEMLIDAVHAQDLEMVNLLLPHSAPRLQDSEALMVAARLLNAALVRLLLPLSDARKVRERLIEEHHRHALTLLTFCERGMVAHDDRTLPCMTTFSERSKVTCFVQRVDRVKRLVNRPASTEKIYEMARG